MQEWSTTWASQVDTSQASQVDTLECGEILTSEVILVFLLSRSDDAKCLDCVTIILF